VQSGLIADLMSDGGRQNSVDARIGEDVVWLLGELLLAFLEELARRRLPALG